MNIAVSIRSFGFEIFTGGDWGGGEEEQAIEDVLSVLRGMKLPALVSLHEKLLDEQQMPDHSLADHFADEAICDPIRGKHANPPASDGAYGATLHIRAFEHSGKAKK